MRLLEHRSTITLAYIHHNGRFADHGIVQHAHAVAQAGCNVQLYQTGLRVARA